MVIIRERKQASSIPLLVDVLTEDLLNTVYLQALSLAHGNLMNKQRCNL